VKRLWIAVGLLITVIVLCVVTERYQHHRMEEMLTTLDQLEEAYEQGDVTRARALADEMTREYEHISRVIMCFTAHSDIAESQETVMLLPTLLRQNSYDELTMEIARLREEFSHLRDIDDPYLRNIL